MRLMVLVVALAGCATPIEIPGTEGNTSLPPNNVKANSSNAENGFNASGADASGIGDEDMSPSPAPDARPDNDEGVAFADAHGDTGGDGPDGSSVDGLPDTQVTSDGADAQPSDSISPPDVIAD